MRIENDELCIKNDEFLEVASRCVSQNSDFATDLRTAVTAVALQQGTTSDADALGTISFVGLTEVVTTFDYTLEVPDALVGGDDPALLAAHGVALQQEIETRCVNMPINSGCVRYFVELDTTTDCRGAWSICGNACSNSTYNISMVASEGGRGISQNFLSVEKCDTMWEFT